MRATLVVKISKYQTLSWKVRVRAQRLRSFKNISNSSRGVDERAVGVHLAAQAVDQDIDHISLRIETIVPDVLEDHGLGNDPAGVAHEIFQKGKLMGLQVDLLLAARDFAGEQVEGEAADGQAGGFGHLRGAAD